MAATAEALLNTLAGGSDSGNSESGDSGAEQHGAGGEGTGGDRPAGEGSQPQLGDAPAGDGQAATAAGAEPAKPADQVANLNAALRQERAERKRLEQQYTELSAKVEA